MITDARQWFSIRSVYPAGGYLTVWRGEAKDPSQQRTVYLSVVLKSRNPVTTICYDTISLFLCNMKTSPARLTPDTYAEGTCMLSGLTLCNPLDHSLPDSPFMGFSGKNTGVGCHLLLQGIFLIQGWNPCPAGVQLQQPGNQPEGMSGVGRE